MISKFFLRSDRNVLTTVILRVLHFGVFGVFSLRVIHNKTLLNTVHDTLSFYVGLLSAREYWPAR